MIQKDSYYECVKTLDVFPELFVLGKTYYSPINNWLVDESDKNFLINGAKNYSDCFKLKSKNINQ